MSFLDFLKREVAYVAIGEFKPGKFATVQQLFEKAISTYGKGYKGSYLLQKPGTDEGIAIIFWENIGDMEANANETHQAVLAEINTLFVKPPVTTFYEVASDLKPNLEAQPALIS